jgi:hypothetical protein
MLRAAMTVVLTYMLVPAAFVHMLMCRRFRRKCGV